MPASPISRRGRIYGHFVAAYLEYVMNKFGKILLFGLLSFLLGAFAGAVVWLVLTIMSAGIDLLWEFIPKKLALENMLFYNVAVCLAGGLLIGLWQKKHGILPDDMEQVMSRIKKEGSYPYDRLPVITVSALLPLIFGGALGPEAGLSGLIAGLCCFIGDRLKYKGHEVAALAESGIAATLGVIFNAPLFGIIGNVEPDNKNEKYGEKLADKKDRIFIYIMGVVGGMLAMSGLGRLSGTGMGLPRFDAHHGYGWQQWKWFILLLVAGVFFGFLYLCINKVTGLISAHLLSHRIASCLVAGIVVAVVGYFLPLTMFSGEHEMGEMMHAWQSYSVALLLFTAIGKLLLVSICINFGWKGGSIFPIIFAGLCLGYAMAMVTGMDGSFAVAVTIAALYAYISRKPLMVVAVLLLCFPLTYLLPMLLSAFVASKIPVPKALAKKE